MPLDFLPQLYLGFILVVGVAGIHGFGPFSFVREIKIFDIARMIK